MTLLFWVLVLLVLGWYYGDVFALGPGIAHGLRAIFLKKEPDGHRYEGPYIVGCIIGFALGIVAYVGLAFYAVHTIRSGAFDDFFNYHWAHLRLTLGI